LQEYLNAEAELRSKVRSAFHEAGHAVASEVLLRGVEFVTIQEEIKVIGDKQYVFSGFNQPRNEGRRPLTSIEALHTELVVTFAGPLAEYSVMTADEQKNENWTYIEDDSRIAHGLCNRLELTAAERAEAMHRAMVSSADFVNNNSATIEVVAAALWRSTRLSGEEVSEIVRKCLKESSE